MSSKIRRVHAVIFVFETEDDHFSAVVTRERKRFTREPFATRDGCLHDAARELARRYPSRFTTPSNEVP